MTEIASPTRRAPHAVTVATVAWFAAIAAGVVEALVHVVLLPDPPTGAQLLTRFGIYTAVAVLVAALPSGRNAVRWALAVLLGGIGTLSLVVEPVGWLAAGGDPVGYLGAADGPTVLVVAVRLLHLVAVGAAMALMFRPSATAYFRGSN